MYVSMCDSVSLFLGEIVCVRMSWFLGVVNNGVARYVPYWVVNPNLLGQPGKANPNFIPIDLTNF